MSSSAIPGARPNGNGKVPAWKVVLGTVGVLLLAAFAFPRAAKLYQPASPVDLKPIVAAIEQDGFATRRAISELMLAMEPPPGSCPLPMPATPPGQPGLTAALERFGEEVAAVKKQLAALQALNEELTSRPPSRPPGSAHPSHPEQDSGLAKTVATLTVRLDALEDRHRTLVSAHESVRKGLVTYSEAYNQLRAYIVGQPWAKNVPGYVRPGTTPSTRPERCY